MQKYIFASATGSTSSICRDLKKFREAYGFVRELAAGAEPVFIGTKKQHRHRAEEPRAARLLRQPAVAGRDADELRDDPQVDRRSSFLRLLESAIDLRIVAKFVSVPPSHRWLT